MDQSSKPLVSVIIPVYNDAERLKICLQRLDIQTYPRDRYEIIVVDNGSDESIEPVVAPFSKVQPAYEPEGSEFMARNTGLKLARGEVIALIDSDCIPKEDWIEKGVDHLLRAPNAGFVAGGVSVFPRDPQRPNAVELYESLTAFPIRRYVEQDKFGGTGNLFIYRSVFDKVGDFNAKLESGGDDEWGKRVYAAGFEQIYSDDICVLHPARHSLRDLHRKMVRTMGGLHEIYRDQPQPQIHWFRLFLHELKLPMPLIREIYSSDNLGSFVQKTQVAYIAIYMKYLRSWERWRLRLRDKLRRRA
jgi:glycosyltransferase involved in cell wall biosynthesis